jgi:hypothetical protein
MDQEQALSLPRFVILSTADLHGSKHGSDPETLSRNDNALRDGQQRVASLAQGQE